MNLTLLFPLGLAALAALILPILIHVVRRIDEQLVDFAALRWLQSRVRPRRRPRFDELLLLFLRLLLLALLAFWLAQPLLHGMKPGKPWLLVAPSLPTSALPKDDGKHELHWLAPAFPRIEAGTQAPPVTQPIASLLREADATIPQGTAVTIMVPDVLDGADAERPRLSREVGWTVAKSSPATVAEPHAALPSPVALRVSPGMTGQAKWFHAVDAAWRALPGADALPVLQMLPNAQPPQDSDRVLVWLDAAPLPANIHTWVRDGGTVLLAHDPAAQNIDQTVAIILRDNDAKPVLRATSLGKGRMLRFAADLDARQLPLLTDPRFPLLLRDALRQGRASSPARVAAATYKPSSGVPTWPVAPRPLQPLLAWLLLTVFCIERLLANAPRREVGR